MTDASFRRVATRLSGGLKGNISSKFWHRQQTGTVPETE